MVRIPILAGAFLLLMSAQVAPQSDAPGTPPDAGVTSPAMAPQPQSDAPSTPPDAAVTSPAIWQDRGNIAALDLIGGPGGRDHQPGSKFTFTKEDLNGTSPKFDVVDENGVHWKVKLGAETRAETATNRLVWAVGYFADEDYYLPEIRVDNMPKLQRGAEFVTAGGVVRGVRMKRKIKGQEKNGNWSWSKNPFAGTKELNGLRVLMALTNNWDLKDTNNTIYETKGEATHYAVTDLGATFGRTGNTMSRSKDNLKDYRATKFIQGVKAGYVDFILKSRPMTLAAIDVPYYAERTSMQDIVKHIPRADAIWVGELLGQLSPEQIRDCFRAAGFSPEEVEGFAAAVQQRIAALKSLPSGDWNLTGHK